MRKYFTWRCIGLHVLALVLVPAFLLAGWWQYHVAMGGNELGWVYTVEWPFFAVYAVYIWWKLIHDESTPIDRFWAAKQRAAADESGRPIHEIPGWATDKALSRAVAQASVEAARIPVLAGKTRGALESHDQKMAGSDRAGTGPDGRGTGEQFLAASGQVGARDDEQTAPVIDARVVEVRVAVDEELDAYNRYLADLAWSDPPRRWGSPRRPSGGGDRSERGAPDAPPDGPVAPRRSGLPSGAGKAVTPDDPVGHDGDG